LLRKNSFIEDPETLSGAQMLTYCYVRSASVLRVVSLQFQELL